MKSWLFAIAKKRYFLYLRKQKHAPLSFDELFDEAVSAETDVADTVYEKRLLQDAFAVIFSFREPMKSVFLLRIFCQTPYDSLAKELGITVNAAKVAFHRGKRLLRKTLKEEYGYEIDLSADR